MLKAWEVGMMQLRWLTSTSTGYLNIPAVYKPHSQAMRRKPDYAKIDIAPRMQLCTIGALR